ncbi:hypothetical protein LBMAG03_12240 [Actinomycetes bacterium]|nr:hypothetical protein LBMAG03_12240 [Actinomycetes bacterium]
MTLPRILAIMGSGETAPTMVSTHRRLTSLLPSPVRAVVLDTPYGFQENAPELAQRAVDYFATSVNVDLRIAGLTRMQTNDHGESADAVTIEKGLRMIDDADYVFAGPGSPTYSLRQWNNTPLRAMLIQKLTSGGVVTFASAAALTLGRRTVPVYEIYKAGVDPYWLEGLDILGEFGIRATVIPHFDNAEGGHHDTRFCYLGERRLQILERHFDDDEFVIGVDEHTGLVIDFDREVAEVVGNSTVTLRKNSQQRTWGKGDSIPLTELRQPSWMATTNTDQRSPRTPSDASSIRRSADGAVDTATELEPSSLGAAVDVHRAAFDAAVDRMDADAAVGAVLALESAIRAWSADTLQSPDRDRAVATLRLMISKLGEVATGGLRDPRSVAEPFVSGFLAVRAVVRAEKRFDLSDLVRDQLLAAGIEVRDTKDGVEWVLRS